VVFSFERAKSTTASFKLYTNESGTARRIDDDTVELTTAGANPVELETVQNIFIMSRAWCEKNKSMKPQDITAREETFAALNSNGTGPFILVSREPGVKTTHKRNPDWWGIKAGRFDGNVDTVEYRQVANGATRNAALRSGELDFVLDPPVQDIASLKEDPAIRVWEGQETRIIFVGFDQARDELLYSTVKGKNPFKDRRVRLALWQAIDTQALKTQVMRGLSVPTAVMFAPQVDGYPKDLDHPKPPDRARAKKLIAEAGYPNGFEVTLDCPNNRYVADEKICVAAAAMWAQIGVTVKVNAMPRAIWGPKTQNRDTSMYMLGWGVPTFDSQYVLQSLMRTYIPNTADGDYNLGGYSNPQADALIDKQKTEVDPKKRAEIAYEVSKIHMQDFGHIPLHFQMIPWAMRSNVSVVHRADNFLTVKWVKVN